MQSDYVALLHRILRALAHADAPTIDNVLACVVDAQNAMHAASYMVDRTVIGAQFREADRRLDRAAQHLWGSYPPEGIRVDNYWHYSVTE